MSWCTIESDPGVFTALCEEVGVKGATFEEVYTLEPESFAVLDAEKTFGLVFLFKWQGEADTRPTVDAANHGIFFAHQVIQNACATQAILSVLLNVNSKKLELGAHLTEFKEFTGMLDPQMKGLAIGNSDVIRNAHNSFRHQSSFEIEEDKDSKKGDAFHFIGYICHEGKVFELDGLKPNPILIGEVPAGTAWMELARVEVKRRIDAYAAKAAASGGDKDGGAELRFNLMAITSDRMREAEKLIERERFLRQRANISLVSRGEDVMLEDEVDDDDAPADIPSFDELSGRELPDVHKLISNSNSIIKEQEVVVAEEKKKRAKWSKENTLRRTDLVPLALCAMRHLARQKQLLPAFEKGKVTHLKRVEDKKVAEAGKAS
jgi:ubiquitin carboxyl-terminal hydrolase L5